MSDAKLAKLMITEFSASVGPASVLTQMASEGFSPSSFICLYLCGGPIHVLLSTALTITPVLNEKK